MPSLKDYYGILDVPADAPAEQIRKAFRALAFVCHPDLAGPDAPGADAFVEIREAYEVLISDERRRSYDADLAAERLREAAARAQARVKVERPGARQAYSPRYTEQRLRVPLEGELIHDVPPSRRPHDLLGSIEVDLEETLRPSLVTIILPPEGAVTEGRRIQVRLPGRLYAGACVRVPSQGIGRSGHRGHLYVEVLLRAHPNFRLCAGTLFHDVPVRPWQAALGFALHVPTLEGIERVAVPPLLSTPWMRRLTGRGLYRRDGERGDIWVNLKLEVPPPTTWRARRLWAELADEYRTGQRPS